MVEEIITALSRIKVARRSFLSGPVRFRCIASEMREPAAYRLGRNGRGGRRRMVRAVRRNAYVACSLANRSREASTELGQLHFIDAARAATGGSTLWSLSRVAIRRSTWLREISALHYGERKPTALAGPKK